MIDLKPFCSSDTDRPNLHKPFSLGELTYATNGRIIVRVPRRADVPEIEHPPNAERVFPKPPATAFRPVGKVDLPPESIDDCKLCDARGTRHDCPDCSCECEDCDGKGTVSGDVETSLSIGGVPFGLQFVRLIVALPALEIAFPVKPGKDSPLEFRFTGGDGLIMPRSVTADTHLDIDLLPEPAP
jgi:hypothetical protein